MCLFFIFQFEFLVQIFLQAFLRTSVLNASEVLHIGCIGNITKPLWILCQLSKLFLDFGWGRKFVMTLPHLTTDSPRDSIIHVTICSSILLQWKCKNFILHKFLNYLEFSFLLQKNQYKRFRTYRLCLTLKWRKADETKSFKTDFVQPRSQIHRN